MISGIERQKQARLSEPALLQKVAGRFDAPDSWAARAAMTLAREACHDPADLEALLDACSEASPAELLATLRDRQIAAVRAEFPDKSRTVAFGGKASGSNLERFGAMAQALRAAGMKVLFAHSEAYGDAAPPPEDGAPSRYIGAGVSQRLDTLGVFVESANSLGERELRPDLPRAHMPHALLFSHRDSEAHRIQALLSLQDKFGDYDHVLSADKLLERISPDLANQTSDRVLQLPGLMSPPGYRFHASAEVAFRAVGYPKLEALMKAAERTPMEPATLVYAPTPAAHGMSSLPRHGMEILDVLLGSFPALCVLFRPYPGDHGAPACAAIVERHGRNPCFEFDKKDAHAEGYARSAVMVSDVSYTKYTYGFALLRPVVSYQPTPYNPGEDITKLFFHPCGCNAHSPEQLAEAVRHFLAANNRDTEAIRAFRDERLANVGNSVRVATEAVIAILRGDSKEWLRLRLRLIQSPSSEDWVRAIADSSVSLPACALQRVEHALATHPGHGGLLSLRDKALENYGLSKRRTPGMFRLYETRESLGSEF